MRLSALNPASLFFGPIFQKEVRTAGRKRGTYIMRAMYGAALLALVATAFLAMRNSTSMFFGVRRLMMLQQLAPMMALIVLWFQFIALCLAAPIFTGPAVCDEKRARTLSALMTTPLTAAQIVLGKLASRVVQVIILALLAMPILLAVRVFGGLDTEVVLAGTSMALSAALLGAALGLMFSVWHKRGTGAAVFALLTLVLLMGAPSAVEGVLVYVLNDSELYVGRAQRSYQYHRDILSTCAPAVMALLSQTVALGGDLKRIEFEWITVDTVMVGATPQPVPLILPMWVVNTAYNLLLTVLVIGYTTQALRRVMLREAAGEGGAAETEARPRRKARGAQPPQAAAPVEGAAEPAVADGPDAAPPEPVGHEAARSREVSDRPVLWREVRQAAFGSRKWFKVIAALTAVGLVLLYWSAGSTWGPFSLTRAMQNEGLHGTLMILGAIAVMVQPVFMTTGSIASEREARTWDALLTTPLTGRHVMFGKFVGALRIQWFIPGLVLLNIVIAAATGFINPALAPLLALTFLGPTLFFTATGQLLSLALRRAVTAAACNLMLALLLWLGTWVGMAMIAWFVNGADGDWFEHALAACYCLNPVAMASTMLEGVSQRARGWWMHDMFAINGSRVFHVGTSGLSMIVLGVFAFYALGAAAAMFAAVRGFRRLSGRSS